MFIQFMFGTCMSQPWGFHSQNSVDGEVASARNEQKENAFMHKLQDVLGKAQACCFTRVVKIRVSSFWVPLVDAEEVIYIYIYPIRFTQQLYQYYPTSKISSYTFSTTHKLQVNIR